MYPFVRFAWQMWRHRNDPPLDFFETHVSQHYCLPQDLDLWAELNNGRTLTLYDLSRLPAARRMGVTGVLKANRWGITVAGLAIRYRRRVTLFQRLEMRTRFVGWDARFLYSEQSMWRPDGECTSHAMLRSAIVGGGRRGIVPPAELAARLGHDGASPQLPPHVAAWAEAEALRPWPPMSEEP